MSEVHHALYRLEAASGRSFGGVERPLLVSVRSGAAVSMPGMMDTILNLGLTARSALLLAQGAGGPRFALDTWVRFWRMFLDTALNLDPTDLVEAAREAERRPHEDLAGILRRPPVRWFVPSAPRATNCPRRTTGRRSRPLCLAQVGGKIVHIVGIDDRIRVDWTAISDPAISRP